MSSLSPIPGRGEVNSSMLFGGGRYMKLDQRIPMKDVPKLKKKEEAKGSIKGVGDIS